MKKGYGSIQLLLVVIALGFLLIIGGIQLRNFQKVGRDTARVSGVKELTIALSTYYFDFNSYPTKKASSITESFNLVPHYLHLLKKDPDPMSILPELGSGVSNGGYFGYVPDNFKKRGAMLVISTIETPAFANFHFSGPFSGEILDSATIEREEIEKRICVDEMIKVELGKARKDHPCEYEDDSQLRFIIVKYND